MFCLIQSFKNLNQKNYTTGTGKIKFSRLYDWSIGTAISVTDSQWNSIKLNQSYEQNLGGSIR